MTVKRVMRTQLLVDKNPSNLMAALNSYIRDIEDKGWEAEIHYAIDGDIGYTVLLEAVTFEDIEDKNDYRSW